jgi:hypothetical protein
MPGDRAGSASGGLGRVGPNMRRGAGVLRRGSSLRPQPQRAKAATTAAAAATTEMDAATVDAELPLPPPDERSTTQSSLVHLCGGVRIGSVRAAHVSATFLSGGSYRAIVATADWYARGTLSNDQITAAVARVTLSNDQITAAVARGTLSNDQITAAVARGTLSNDQITAAVAKVTLSNDQITAAVARGTLSNDHRDHCCRCCSKKSQLR